LGIYLLSSSKDNFRGRILRGKQSNKIGKDNINKGGFCKMMNMFLKRRLTAEKNKKKGFTLIEVIVVIVIIAILAAIAVPSLTRYIGSAGLRADMAMGHNIQVVLQAELSELYDSGTLINVPSAAGSMLASPLNNASGSVSVVTVQLALEANGVMVPNGVILSYIGTTGSTAKLESFIYTTSNSIVAYNGVQLHQFPRGTGTGQWNFTGTTVPATIVAWATATTPDPNGPPSPIVTPPEGS
jgi:prepilin-type N-terminal cleavage/methylation domain-containing protein